MKISAAIMAHPERSAEVAELQDELDRPVMVHWDREGPPSGNGDRVWRQARAAWLMADPGADWHVLIQDDALVSRHFLAGLERALEHVPNDAVVSPYLGMGRNVPRRWEAMAQNADLRGARWIVSGRVMWGVCLVLPVMKIQQVVDWCDRKAGMPDDMRVSAWATRHQIDTWYPWPSLVDHRRVPSLTKHRAADRVARRHHTGSALHIDWGGPVVIDPMLSWHRGPRSLNRVRSGPTSPRTGKVGNGA